MTLFLKPKDEKSHREGRETLTSCGCAEGTWGTLLKGERSGGISHPASVLPTDGKAGVLLVPKATAGMRSLVPLCPAWRLPQPLLLLGWGADKGGWYIPTTTFLRCLPGWPAVSKHLWVLPFPARPAMLVFWVEKSSYESSFETSDAGHRLLRLTG